MSFILNIDKKILLYLSQIIHAPNLLIPISKFITALGNAGFIWLLLGVIFTIKNDTRKNGIIMLISLIASFIICNLFLKIIITRDRPFTELGFLPLITAPKDFSFPSGHTLSSFTGAISIFMFNKKYGILAIILAILIGISRLVLLVHYPSDVIIGAFLGIIIAILTKIICEKSYNKFK